MTDTSQQSIITISGLTKKFGQRAVLSDINIKINPGDSIAFIGRNGCGKSTLLRIIAGVLPFEQGSVIHRGKLKFGYVPDRFPAMDLTAMDYIRQIGMISGLQKEAVDKRSKELFEALFMKDMIETPIRYLSKGTIQKMAVVQAFITTPDVLLLDEPISGQDMASQKIFIEMVNSLNRDFNVTVLCSCHEDYMIQAIATSVYEIVDGKLWARQTEKTALESLCRLLFVKKPGYDFGYVPQYVQEASVKVEPCDGKEVAIFVTSQESDKVIREMLQDNFELRGLNNERIL